MTTLSAPNFKIVNGETFINNAFISETIHAAETLKPKTSNSNIDVGKILDDAWKSGRPCIGEAVNDLAQVIANARASSQTFKQHTIGGEITPLTYTASMSINVNDASSASGVDTNLEALIENALKNAAECAVLDVAKQMAADKKAMDELEKTIRKAIHNECLVGGVIWQRFNR